MSGSKTGCCQNTAEGRELEKILGISLPDGATVTATQEGGIRATQINVLGSVREVEINAEGEVFRSTYCSDSERQMINYQYVHEMLDGPAKEVVSKAVQVPSCLDFNRVKQSGSVSSDKLVHARVMILGTDKPKGK